MTEPIYLLLGIHHHQPVGNFGDVFAHAFSHCYTPLLDALENHPSIKISLHHSGPLVDYALEHEEKYLDRVTKLAREGRIEILGGGYYEPILTILKPQDALAQIELMQRFWRERTGLSPRGMWLAERVWEPSLAALLFDAGISFTILDDEHFRHAGLTDETLFGYYKTERAGKSVSIFPSDKLLRYYIPFKMPEDVISHLLYLQKTRPGMAVTYGDDGEKFGMWPGTYDWVIKNGWLDNFLSALEANKDNIATVTFSEYMEIKKATGRIYLPTASYSEMLQWAMPPSAILNYKQAKRDIEHAGLWERSKNFFRGGFWDNFLTKYPESNLIHKRAIYVSNLIDKAESLGHKLPKARRALYRAQCNCAYWHGLFGGLYLNYLRHALYENLIEALVAVDKVLEPGKTFCKLELFDIDCDGDEEAIVSNEIISCIVKPAAGASLASLDFKPKRFNLMNTLSRKFEAYHAQNEGQRHSEAGAIPSIHDIAKDMTDFKSELIYDRAPRYAFLDHVFESEPDWSSILAGKWNDAYPFDTMPFKITKHGKTKDEANITLISECRSPSGKILFLEKIYQFKKNGVGTHYNLNWKDRSGPPPWFATEINFTLLAGNDPGRHYLWKGITAGTVQMNEKRMIEGINSIEAVDNAFGFRLKVQAKADRILVAPVETISQSEKGFDRLHQGSAIVVALKPEWSAAGDAKFSVGLSIETI